jgi:hypothetical protein
MVKVEIKNGKIELQGDFIFKVFDGVIKEDNGIFSKEIRFKFNPECDANIGDYIKDSELNLLISEKLKEDFIKFLNNE